MSKTSETRADIAGNTPPMATPLNLATQTINQAIAAINLAATTPGPVADAIQFSKPLSAIEPSRIQDGIDWLSQLVRRANAFAVANLGKPYTHATRSASTAIATAKTFLSMIGR